MRVDTSSSAKLWELHLDYTIDFIPVGNSNGDAIVLRYGDAGSNALTTDIIDGGYTEVGEAIIQHLRTRVGHFNIANVVLTHADDDHARGLIPILERCNVQNLYMNRPWKWAQYILHYDHGNKTLQTATSIDPLRSLAHCTIDFAFGSWPCENAGASRRRRITFSLANRSRASREVASRGPTG